MNDNKNPLGTTTRPCCCCRQASYVYSRRAIKPPTYYQYCTDLLCLLLEEPFVAEKGRGGSADISERLAKERFDGW